MDSKRKLGVFILFFLFAFIYYRVRVYLSFNDGSVPFLRAITGLTIHHYHFGLLIILIAAMTLIFYRVNSFSVGLMGFGLGAVFDSFIARLMSFNSVRMVEIARYNYSFVFTLGLIVNVIMLSLVFYFWNEKDKV